MSPKFWLRTFRNMVLRTRPYFAHLAITHTCNLKCSFCHIPEERVQEQDTEGMKRIIDRLDRMGIAILSISGGGEPLLRADFAAILNYAAGRGMYTKITSNGTMPPSKYAELLASRVSEIAISLDGVRGNNVPFSHVGPKILDSIRFLNDNLPGNIRLTLNITISSANRDQVDEIVAYCTREYPRARLWLNPVVVGQGKLRVLTQAKVNPDYLRRVDSPTLLTPTFYKQGAEDYYRSEIYNWGCLAGEMFFDIKPNGDFWICQDHPAKTPLNILDPEFEDKYRRADFSHRRACSGCTYSCYWVTQKAFEPRNWPGMAGVWWKTVTQPNEPCQKSGKKYGWAVGLLHLGGSRLLSAARWAGRSALSFALLLTLESGMDGRAQTLAPSETWEGIVARMEVSNERRREALQSYRDVRRYVASNLRFRCQGYLVVEELFAAPQDKRFRVLSRGGSRAIERMVFAPLLESELANARPTACGVVDICRRNYTFTFSEYDNAAKAYVFNIEPRTPNRYLLRGKVWINSDDFGIQRVEGEPAHRVSFWIHRTKFVHEYDKFGEFWFPVRTRSEVELRLFGRATMGIDYLDYDWQPQNGPRRDHLTTPIEGATLSTSPSRQSPD